MIKVKLLADQGLFVLYVKINMYFCHWRKRLSGYETGGRNSYNIV